MQVQARPRLLLTLPEAAESLNISVKSLRKLIYAGELLSVHVGSLHRVSQRALDEFVQRLERAHGAR